MYYGHCKCPADQRDLIITDKYVHRDQFRNLKKALKEVKAK
jgi:hypothetical protein